MSVNITSHTDNEAAGKLHITVAYASAPNKQHLLPIVISSNTNVAKVLSLPDVAVLISEKNSQPMASDMVIDLQDFSNRVGIFGKKVGLDYILQQGDRLEIYRPLTHDPMQQRQNRRQALKKAQQ